MLIRYNPGQIKKFFIKYDWNKMFQEITTVLIGIGVGLYCYEIKALPGIFRPLEDITGINFNSLPFSEVVATTKKPFFKIGAVIVGISILIKILIYLGIFDANTLKGALYKKKIKKKRKIDINGIIQEILTALLGFAIGLFTNPIVKNSILWEKTEYPNPIPGITLTITCIILKILIYSEALNFNGGRVWNPGKIKPFLGKYDWNEFFHELSSTCIGIGIGLYMYESGIVLKFAKYLEPVKQEANNILKEILGSTLSKQVIEIVPLWNNHTTRPYIIAGAVIVGICVLIKISLYTSLWNANKLRDFLLKRKIKTSYPSRIDLQGIMDEIVTLLLTTILSIISTPFLKNAFSDHKEPCPFLFFGVIALLILSWIKFAMITGALSFGSPRLKINSTSKISKKRTYKLSSKRKKR